MAEREQNSDLKNFLKRETVIPTNEDQELPSPRTIRWHKESDRNTDSVHPSLSDEDDVLAFHDKNNDDHPDYEETRERFYTIKEQQEDGPTEDDGLQEEEKEHEQQNMRTTVVEGNSFDEEENEDEMDSDIEDMFMDALSEIQDASVKLNQTLGSARNIVKSHSSSDNKVQDTIVSARGI